MVNDRFKASAVLLLTVSRWAAAQVEINQAHILPRAISVSSAFPRPVIRANVDLVLVNVTVLDHSDRAVTGQASANISVLPHTTPQLVSYRSSVDEPTTL